MRCVDESLMGSLWKGSVPGVGVRRKWIEGRPAAGGCDSKEGRLSHCCEAVCGAALGIWVGEVVCGIGAVEQDGCYVIEKEFRQRPAGCSVRTKTVGMGLYAKEEHGGSE